MDLQYRLDHNQLLIYREKWGTLAFVAILSAGCLALAITFYWLTRDHSATTRIVPQLCSAAFGIAACAILFHLPRFTKRLHKDDGAIVLGATAAGITLTPSLMANEKRLVWSDVEEFVLAEKLRIVESDETSYRRRVIIVFLTAPALKADNWLERLKTSISRSARGRLYLLCSYPRGQAVTIQAALRQFAPDSVRVRVQQRVIFDMKAATDSYKDA